MARQHGRTQEEAEINITPMLDMVFILLIFFIVTSSFVRLPGAKVTRPTAMTAARLNASTLLAVTASGQIWINKKKISLDQVQGLVKSSLAQAPNGNVVIIADKHAPTGLVVKVMGQAKQAGASNIAIAAKEAGAKGS
ncbi:MAG: ExbD/TolR family protein [Gammaproteobacteria bacterium]